MRDQQTVACAECGLTSLSDLACEKCRENRGIHPTQKEREPLGLLESYSLDTDFETPALKAYREALTKMFEGYAGA